MYIQNRRDSSKFNGCSPLQNCNGLISLKPAIAYFAYTKRCATFDQKMRNRILTILFLAINLTIFGQESKDCYEIKYLDFFGLDKMEIIKWPESELDVLSKMDFAKDKGKSEIKTNFIIPMIVYQLAEYHPNCKQNIDTNYFNKSSEIYLKIREIDSTDLLQKSIADKIDFVQSDFYSQVENVEYLPKMTATF